MLLDGVWQCCLQTIENPLLQEQVILTLIKVIVFLCTHCKERRTPKLERRIIGRRQYPSTLDTQPKETPVILIRLSRQYMPRQPIALIPYTQPNWILPDCEWKEKKDTSTKSNIYIHDGSYTDIYVCTIKCKRIFLLIQVLKNYYSPTVTKLFTRRSVAPKAKQKTMGPARSVSFMMLPSATFSGWSTVRVFCQMWSKLIPNSKTDKTHIRHVGSMIKTSNSHGKQ